MLRVSQRADFCVRYFNLRGWKCIDRLVDVWAGGAGGQARVLVGVQQLPEDELRRALRLSREGDDGPTIDQQTGLRLKKRMVEEFRNQLTLEYREKRGSHTESVLANRCRSAAGYVPTAMPTVAKWGRSGNGAGILEEVGWHCMVKLPGYRHGATASVVPIFDCP
jgi:hypothetical protein